MALDSSRSRVKVCPHCNTGLSTRYFLRGLVFADPEQTTDYLKVCQVLWDYCPVCEKAILILRRGTGKPQKDNYYGRPSYELRGIEKEELLFPKHLSTVVGNDVPEVYRSELAEASAVLSLSPKASAALSRRLLQTVLREEFNVRRGSLAKEIESFIQRDDLPTYLADQIDAVRNIGNFAAHPIKDKSTGEIVEVEPGEAEWLIEVLKDLFDFAFVRPRRLAERKNRLNEKQSAAGKPPMK